MPRARAGRGPPRLTALLCSEGSCFTQSKATPSRELLYSAPLRELLYSAPLGEFLYSTPLRELLSSGAEDAAGAGGEGPTSLQGPNSALFLLSEVPLYLSP